MNIDRIKNLLHAWRPGADAPADAARAREEAAGNEELSAWLDKERAFDEAFANKLRQVRAPQGLAERIIAAAADDRVVAFEDSLPRIEAGQAWWRPFALGAAASVAIGIGLYSLVLDKEPAAPASAQAPVAAVFAGPNFDMSSFVNEAVKKALEEPMESEQGFRNVYSRLVEADAPTPEALPPNMQRLNTVGCRVFDVRGLRMSMICMRGEQLYHLMVAEQSHVGPGCSRYARPVVYDLGDQFAATWVSEGKLFIMVTTRAAEGEQIVRSLHDI